MVTSDLAPPNPKQMLAPQTLDRLNARSNRKGWLQLAGHLAIMAASGWLWATQRHQLWLALPALVVYGFSFAAMFAPMHECAHRTAFASNRLNDLVCWLAGLLSFYNGTFYRRYHKWHHRYTQILDKDPELSDPKPTNLREYWLELSGWSWWVGKLRSHFRVAIGRLEDCPYIPEAARAEVMRSTQLQLAVYGAAILLSAAVGKPWFVMNWLLPLMVGQPILRVILLAEHTGCSHTNNPLTNTRTTLTIAPIRFLMWNMPFHAEHHLYASIPFHALPAAHEQLRPYFQHVDPGYVAANRQIVAQFQPSNP